MIILVTGATSLRSNNSRLSKSSLNTDGFKRLPDWEK